ncbi:hypothetical protein B0H13DRAFT_1877373 [Mycena leptocephala]|nr:hypothetical protein B0H13DRAFT_1877373 [Mycena leptocephala]
MKIWSHWSWGLSIFHLHIFHFPVLSFLLPPPFPTLDLLLFPNSDHTWASLPAPSPATARKWTQRSTPSFPLRYTDIGPHTLLIPTRQGEGGDCRAIRRGEYEQDPSPYPPHLALPTAATRACTFQRDVKGIRIREEVLHSRSASYDYEDRDRKRECECKRAGGYRREGGDWARASGGVSPLPSASAAHTCVEEDSTHHAKVLAQYLDPRVHTTSGIHAPSTSIRARSLTYAIDFACSPLRPGTKRDWPDDRQQTIGKPAITKGKEGRTTRTTSGGRVNAGSRG